MANPELDEAVAIYRRLLAARRQVQWFTAWPGTLELLRSSLRRTEEELSIAERRYLEKPD